MASSLKPQQISARSEKWIRFSAIAVMFIVAVASMVLSFDGLRKLATEAKISEQLAFLFPVIVDGTIIMASLAILRMNLSGQRAVLGWVTMFLGTGLSIAGNVISVRNEGIIAMGTHALPPILLATSLELFLSLIRTNIKLAQDAQEAEERLQTLSSQSNIPQIALNTPVDVAQELPPASPLTLSENEPVNLYPAPTVNNEEEKLPDLEPTVAAVVLPAPEKTDATEPEDAVVEDESKDEVPVPKIVFETVLEPEHNVEPVEAAQTPSSSDSIVDENVNPSAERQEVHEMPAVDLVETKDKPAVAEPVVEPAVEPKQESVAKTKADNENVVNYKKILERLKPETKKHIKIAAILSRFPDAKSVDIKRAIGDPANARYSEHMEQAKAFLIQRAQQKAKA